MARGQLQRELRGTDDPAQPELSVQAGHHRLHRQPQRHASDTAENEFEGHYANNDGTPEVRLGLKLNSTAEAMGMSGDDDPTRLYNPGAIAGVWAESNTREDIWNALHRRETFGTSGTRTQLRIFAGYEFADDAHLRPDWVAKGYSQDVPQRGDLPAAPAGKAPALVIRARHDPRSAPGVHRRGTLRNRCQRR